MKKVKMNAVKLSTYFGVLLLSLSVGCADNNKKQSDSQIVQGEAPKIDLQTAVLTGDKEAIQGHIAAQSDINAKDPMSGSTPLITAASFGKIKITEMLIEAGADLELKNNDGATALHCAAFFGRVEIVQLLLDAQADPNARNNFGATPKETITGSFEEMRPIYEMLQQQLSPLGMQLDLEEVEKARPVIAMMLQ